MQISHCLPSPVSVTGLQSVAGHFHLLSRTYHNNIYAIPLLSGSFLVEFFLATGICLPSHPVSSPVTPTAPPSYPTCLTLVRLQPALIRAVHISLIRPLSYPLSSVVPITHLPNQSAHAHGYNYHYNAVHHTPSPAIWRKRASDGVDARAGEMVRGRCAGMSLDGGRRVVGRATSVGCAGDAAHTY